MQRSVQLQQQVIHEPRQKNMCKCLPLTREQIGGYQGQWSCRVINLYGFE
jgi:hypothetical protein